MQAAERGDEGTVGRFTPMALMAYTQLDSIDADARFHAAMLRMHSGDVAGAKALADSILRATPGDLLAYVLLGSAARFEKNAPALDRSYRDFLKHYDAEMRAKRPGYEEHSRSIEDFRKAALEAHPAGS
jgi:hypothetical protein